MEWHQKLGHPLSPGSYTYGMKHMHKCSFSSYSMYVRIFNATYKVSDVSQSCNEKNSAICKLLYTTEHK